MFISTPLAARGSSCAVEGTRASLFSAVVVRCQCPSWDTACCGQGRPCFQVIASTLLFQSGHRQVGNPDSQVRPWRQFPKPPAKAMPSLWRKISAWKRDKSLGHGIWLTALCSTTLCRSFRTQGGSCYNRPHFCANSPKSMVCLPGPGSSL